MTRRTCGREPEVLRAVNGGRREEMLEHLAQCGSCQQAVTVAELLHTAADLEETPLPDPGRIYWRAQLMQRWALAERATRSIRLVQRIAATAAIGLAVALVAAAWPVLAAAMRLISLPAIDAPGAGIAGATTAGVTLLVVTLVMCWWTASLDDV